MQAITRVHRVKLSGTVLNAIPATGEWRARISLCARTVRVFACMSVCACVYVCVFLSFFQVLPHTRADGDCGGGDGGGYGAAGKDADVVVKDTRECDGNGGSSKPVCVNYRTTAYV